MHKKKNFLFKITSRRENREMITDKKTLCDYLDADRKALGISRKKPSIFGDEVWKYEIALRYMEYHQNVKGGGNEIILEMATS